MLKTALLVFLFSTANPNEPTRLLHKTFDSPQACQRAIVELSREMPAPPEGVRVSVFCETVADLADERVL